jgi:hypothetical protein
MYSVDISQTSRKPCSEVLMPSTTKTSLQGGEETLVLDQPYRDFTISSGGAFIAWWDWALVRNGIYFLNFESYYNATVEFFDFSTHKIIPIWTLTKPPGFGLPISADGRSILYVQNEVQKSNIMLVKNFR